MDESNNLESLSGPVPTPCPLGPAPILTGGFSPNAQRFAPALSGATPANTTAVQPIMPIGSGETMYNDFEQEDISNVGGVTNIANPNEQSTETFIPETIETPEAEYGSREQRQANRSSRRSKRRARRNR